MRRIEFLQGTLSLGAANLLPGVKLTNAGLGDNPPLTESAPPPTGEVLKTIDLTQREREVTRSFIHHLGDFGLAVTDEPPAGTAPIWADAVRGDWESFKRRLDQNPWLKTVTGSIELCADCVPCSMDYDNLPLIHLLAALSDGGWALRYVISFEVDPNTRHEWGTPLMFAIQWSSKMDNIDYLISNGACVNVQNEHYGTPLHYAARFGNMETINLLISKGGVVDAKTMLHAAAENITESGLKIVKYFVAHGGGVNIKDNDGDTPLHHAASNPNTAILQYLIEKGACLNVRNNCGATPLFYAVWLPENVKLLVSRGADVNVRNNEGLSPLHEAVLWKESAEYLVAQGADVRTRDNEGLTPLDHVPYDHDELLICE